MKYTPNYLCDLHCHTNRSDGNDRSPIELIDRASALFAGCGNSKVSVGSKPASAAKATDNAPKDTEKEKAAEK